MTRPCRGDRMLVPSPRLILAALVVALPLAAAAGMWPAARNACWAALALCVAVAAFDAAAALRRLSEVTLRSAPFLRLTKDAAGAFPVTVENGSGGGRTLRLGVNLPAGVETDAPTLDFAAPEGTSVVEWPCVGRRRGEHALGALHVESASPWGLWLARQARPVALSLRVYPDLRDRADAALFLRTANVGLRVRRQVGKGREFENLRHYLPGDSFEDIHWKATAKRGFPAVKLYRVEHAQEVYAILDASRLSAREGILDSFVNAALHLALVAEKQGDRFGLATFSNVTHTFLRARNGLDHFRLCRETIYNLQPRRVSPDFRDVFTSIQLNVRRRSLIVFLTSLDDALLAETFERDVALLARRHIVLVNVLRTAALRPLFAGEIGGVESLYEGLAGQTQCNRLRALQLSLANRGVRLAVTDPEEIKRQVAAGYLEVKRRQIL
jgi:uncharacterized protein (DUF58 family)